MVVDFDIDGDGKITEQEVAMKERMLEIELREEKAESQKFMAWVAMGMMIIFTVFLFTPFMSDSRVSALADPSFLEKRKKEKALAKRSLWPGINTLTKIVCALAIPICLENLTGYE